MQAKKTVKHTTASMMAVRHKGRALTDAFITKHIQKLITNNVQMMTMCRNPSDIHCLLD